MFHALSISSLRDGSFFSNLGTDGARNSDNVSRKKREVSRNTSSLYEERDISGNSLEKMRPPPLWLIPLLQK
jgi:hypothetical protein